MTTLQALAFNVTAGSALGLSSLFGFGVAVVNQHEYVAPRCAARPKQVIYNAAAYGSPLLGWIPWTLLLSYETLLQGIPGTGTRDNGRAGSLLRLNLDAIVLLRFHAVGLKVSALATLICMGILFPLYWTSECHDVNYKQFSNETGSTTTWQEDACASQAHNLTGYERTTIANVPSFLPDEANELILQSPDEQDEEGATPYNQNWTLLRLYAAVFGFWIITSYLLNLLKREWIEILALRRVYYLEANVWGERKEQLKETLLHDELTTRQQRKQQQRALKSERDQKDAKQEVEEEQKKEEDEQTGHGKKRGCIPRSKNVDEEETKTNTNSNKRLSPYSHPTLRPESHLIDRDPWIPHPEQRDTVSNIQLYSVLVGGLPALPDLTGAGGGAETNLNQNDDGNSMMDWQLALTAAFFDHCVPNQPGFSSSVAAVTLLPSSKAIAAAWSQWYKAAAQLRRLKFVRAQIAQKLYYYSHFGDDDDYRRFSNHDDHDDEEDDNEENHGNPSRKSGQNKGDQENENEVSSGNPYYNHSCHHHHHQPRRRLSSEVSATSLFNTRSDAGDSTSSLPRPIYQTPDQNQEYYRQVTGGNEFGAFLPAALLIPSDGGLEDGEVYSDDEVGEQDGTNNHKENHQAHRRRRRDHHHHHQQHHQGETEEELLKALLVNQFGPEQTAIYSREVAQSAAACCPNGCWEGAVLHATIDELLVLEREAAEAVHRANVELYKARQQAAFHSRSSPRTSSPPSSYSYRLRPQSPCPPPIVDQYPKNDMDAKIQLPPTVLDTKYSSMSSSSSPLKRSNRKTVDNSVVIRNQSPDIDPDMLRTDVMVGDAPTYLGPSASQQQKQQQQLQELEIKDSSLQCGDVELGSWFMKPTFTMEGLFSTLYDSDGHMGGGSGGGDSSPLTPSPPIAGSTVVSPAQSDPAIRRSQRERLPSDLTLEADLLFQNSSKSTSQQQLTQSQQQKQSYHRFGLFPQQQTQPILLPRNEHSFRVQNYIEDEMDTDGDINNNEPSELNAQRSDLVLEQRRRTGSSSTVGSGDDIEAGRKTDKKRDETARQSPGATRYGLGWNSFGKDSKADNNRKSNTAKNANYDKEKKKLSKWELVQSIVVSTRKAMYSARRKPLPTRDKGCSLPSHHNAISGVWHWPSFRDLLDSAQSRAQAATRFLASETTEAMDLSRESSYAVVTFTSRQGALAARHCLADARGGTERWKTDEELPIPPLADAAACDMCVCRNCCRPVAITIDSRQKTWRHYFALLLLTAFYTLSAFPLALVSSIMDPQTLEQAFPKFFEWAERNQEGMAEVVSGFAQSLLWTSFFALCPLFFKMVANSGSNANSVANAELRALQYFWWFMVVTAFSGTLIANMVLFGFNDGKLGGELRTVLRSIARAIPSTTAATWLNWIIFRTTVSMPALYLLQINSFFWDFLRCHCCSRLSRGGGPGPSPPYRLYVDSGVVLMCMLALGTSSPLVAPASCVYFLWCQPLLRRCCIFVYRPKFDGGGLRWPFIFDMIVSALFVGQILLTIQMVLKQAAGPAIAAAAPMIPTLLSAMNMKKKFLKSFRDVALLQTSLLDGWDLSSKECSTMEEREEFRRFLVDAHKAAYIPVCLASTNTTNIQQQAVSLTAEPAVVVPMETDFLRDLLHYVDEDADLVVAPAKTTTSNDSQATEQHSQAGSADAAATFNRRVMERQSSQYGATLRRAEKTLTALRQRAPSKASSGSADAITGRNSSNTMPRTRSMDGITNKAIGGGSNHSCSDDHNSSTSKRE